MQLKRRLAEMRCTVGKARCCEFCVISTRDCGIATEVAAVRTSRPGFGREIEQIHTVQPAGAQLQRSDAALIEMTHGGVLSSLCGVQRVIDER